MRKIIFVCLIAIFLQIGVFAQSSEFQKGLGFAKSNDFQNALVKFQNSLDEKLSDKKLAQVYYNIGVCFYRLNQPSKAVIEFEKATKLNPNYAKVYYGLGMALVDLKDFEKAESNFLKAIRFEEKNGETWFDLALVLCEEQKFEQAKLAFENSIKYKSIAKSIAKQNLEILNQNFGKETAKINFKEQK